MRAERRCARTRAQIANRSEGDGWSRMQVLDVVESDSSSRGDQVSRTGFAKRLAPREPERRSRDQALGRACIRASRTPVRAYSRADREPKRRRRLVSDASPGCGRIGLELAGRPSVANWIREATRAAGAGAEVSRSGVGSSLHPCEPNAGARVPARRSRTEAKATVGLGCKSWMWSNRTRARGATKFRELDSRNDSRRGSRSGGLAIRRWVEPASVRAERRCARTRAQIANRSEGDGWCRMQVLDVVESDSSSRGDQVSRAGFAKRLAPREPERRSRDQALGRACIRASRTPVRAYPRADREPKRRRRLVRPRIRLLAVCRYSMPA